jgi:prepilin-type N-terminal cleavage/methylation domain-containing protein
MMTTFSISRRKVDVPARIGKRRYNVLPAGFPVGRNFRQDAESTFIRREDYLLAVSDTRWAAVGLTTIRFNLVLCGMSLTELLCVIAIIAILASLYLGAIAKAFVRIKKFLDGF